MANPRITIVTLKDENDEAVLFRPDAIGTKKYYPIM